ncbi:MAG TPA: T9SS type A sorting domain-containing protein [Candidatus Kapabacteria bacterium]|nr:T9SS type A sorting domain-containing protein [Candidatus Kapabacteria bacterium]
MKLSKVPVLFLGLYFFSVAGLRAQWANVAPNLLEPEAQRIGALNFGGGVVWAGSQSLYFSLDTGKSWQRSSSFPGVTGIVDIAVFDSQHVLIGTRSEGAFLTTNAGAAWSNVLPPPSNGEAYNRVSFNGSASILHVLQLFPSMLFTSRDGGVNWNSADLSNGGINEGLSFAIGIDKTIHLFSSGSAGWINSSSDFGATWTGNGSGVNADSQGLAADSCDARKLYLVSENTIQRTNNVSNIDISTDGGSTWQTAVSHELDYYSGSIANTAQVIYVSTVPSSGSAVERSTDGGASWKNIGGPTESFDTKAIATVDNNTVLVLDSTGSIWLTKNSGGDSLELPQRAPGGTAIVLSSEHVNVTGTACGPSDTGVTFFIQSCMPLTSVLDSLWITGSPAFTRPCDCPATPSQLSGGDSIPLRFWPSMLGADTAQLHLALTVGGITRDTTIQLIGESTSPSLTAKLHRESATAYRGQFDSLMLGVDIGSQLNIDSLWPSLTDIQATYSWDSSVVSNGSYLPPNGWNLTSLTPHGNAVDFSIHNASSTATNPLNLGTAIFDVTGSQLATSWVELSRFIMEAGGRSIGLCVSENEDSHWAVKTLGASSVVAGTPPTMRNQFFLYPNPSDGNVWITSSEDMGEVTIEVYNMLGTVQSEWKATVQSGAAIECPLPAAAGVYSVVVLSRTGRYSLRVVRAQ